MYHIFIICIVLLLSSSCQKSNMFGDDENSYKSTLRIKHEKLPNFVEVGFKHGDTALPTNTPISVTLSPSRSDDDYERIQSIIDSIQALPLGKSGIRGTILLKRGVYKVSQTLKISKSGIILKGEGSDENGTIIYSTFEHVKKLQIYTLRRAPVILVESPQSTTEKEGLEIKISKDIDVGSVIVPLEKTSVFKVGDTINITKTVNQQWIDLLGMNEYGWTPAAFQMKHERVITKVEKNHITLNIPLVDNILNEFGGGSVQKISKKGITKFVGISDLKIVSNILTKEESQMWSGIELSKVEHCWVKNVGGYKLAFALVNIFHSNYNTVEDCYAVQFKSMPIGDRRYSFYIYGGTGNLIQRCYSEGARHDFATGTQVAGPNVFLDCIAVSSTAAVGPHLRWATGTLYDNIYAGMIQALKANNDGTGHGWTGAHNIYWNNHSYISYTIQNPPTAINWLVGSKGTINSSNDSYVGSENIDVNPRSFYIQQFMLFKGRKKLESIFIAEQLESEPIWDLLSQRYSKFQNLDIKSLIYLE